MQQILAQVRHALRGMWHYRWWGLLAAWLTGIGAVAFIMTMPPRYEASARVYVDTQSILKPLLSGLAVQPNTDQQVALLSRTLLSRPTLEKLVRMADLDADKIGSGRHDDLVDSLMQTIQIRNTGRDNLYTLSFHHTNPDRARRTVQSLVSIFVESGLGRARTDSQQAKKFIDDQIRAYEDKLVSAEERLKQFRIKNIEVVNPDGRDANARLGQAVELHERARLELREARNARNEARRQLEALRSGSASSDVTASLMKEAALSVATPEIDARIEAQRKLLDNLLLRYTDAHPDVVNSRALLRALEEQRVREVTELRRTALASASTSAGPMGPVANSAQAEVMRILAAAEVQVASLQARVDEYGAKVAQARALMKVSPGIEAQAAQLNRDYALNKKSYEDLLARRQSAELSGELDEAAGMAEFRVIDPPRVSPRPVSPNRMLLVGASLLGALVMGLAVAFLLSEMRPVFTSSRHLIERSGLPLLGVVSLVMTPEMVAQRRAGHLRFALASGSFLLVYGAGVAALMLSSRLSG